MPTTTTTDDPHDGNAFAEWLWEQSRGYVRQGTAEGRWLSAKLNDLRLAVIHLRAENPDDFEERDSLLLSDLTA